MRGEKPQNQPVSKNNTGRAALQAALPVKTICRQQFDTVKINIQ